MDGSGCRVAEERGSVAPATERCLSHSIGDAPGAGFPCAEGMHGLPMNSGTACVPRGG